MAPQPAHDLRAVVRARWFFSADWGRVRASGEVAGAAARDVAEVDSFDVMDEEEEGPAPPSPPKAPESPTFGPPDAAGGRSAAGEATSLPDTPKPPNWEVSEDETEA